MLAGDSVHGEAMSKQTSNYGGDWQALRSQPSETAVSTESQEIGAAMKVLGITSQQFCPSCHQM
jgi:hypothetical protein